jgi:hypothetical protein
MPKQFDHETEEAIDMEMVRLEASRRIALQRIEALLENFFYEFPAATESEYKHRMTPSQVINLARQYTGEMVETSYLYAVLRAKQYCQIIDKSDYPVQTYWLFG